MPFDDELQRYLGQIPFKVKRKLVTTLRQEAGKLADAIKDAAPRDTGALANSVQVRRKRNDLALEVTAGGDATTKEIREGSGKPYDYALAVEYGTTDRPAEPFFYPTYEAMRDDFERTIQAAVLEAFNDE